MSVAKIVEISSESEVSFEDAIESGIRRADMSLNHVRGAWIKDQKLRIEGGKIVAYRVILRISFVLQQDAAPVKA